MSNCKNGHLAKKYLEIIVQNRLWRSEKGLALYLDYLFKGTNFAGKSMLDIGGGSGIFSFYSAIKGAMGVTCLEPELQGSTSGAQIKFTQISNALSLQNVIFKPVKLTDFNPGSQKFDIILLHNSINHLNEDACIKLKDDNEARKKYELIFTKLANIAAPQCKLIIADCSRNNIYASLRIRNPFLPSVEWNKHQTPELWSKMLQQHGFYDPKVRWSSFSNYYFGKLLFTNSFMSHLFMSYFVLVMTKKRI